MGTLLTILAVVALFVALLAVLNLVLFKAEYLLEESIEVACSPEAVCAKVADMQDWKAWNPWLQHDPDCMLTYSVEPEPDKVGGSYTWDSPKIGAGTMTHVAIEDGTRIAQSLSFTRPMKAVCQVWWTFVPSGDGTKVTWHMLGRLPFHLRVLSKKMPEWIRNDFRIGLVMLRQELDPKAPRFRLEYRGVHERPAVTGLSHHYSGNLDGLKQHAGKHFPQLLKVAKDGGTVTGEPVMVTNHFNQKTGMFDVTMLVPTTSSSSDDYSTASVPGGKYAKTVLVGSYDHLTLAWPAAFSELTMIKGVKFDKSRKPYELYENNPDEVSPDELRTAIFIPVK